jgi:hypothetical protein
MGQAGRHRLTSPGPFRPGSVAPSHTLGLHQFDDVILTSKMEGLLT